jgi:hypothetical protein
VLRVACRRWFLALAAVALALRPAPAHAHPPLNAVAWVVVDRAGGVTLTIHHDALAFALDDTSQNIPDEPMYELLDSSDQDLRAVLEHTRARFLRRTALAADGAPLPLEITEFPTVAAVRQWERENPARRLPLKMDIVARTRLPARAHEITVTLPGVLGEVILSVDRPGVDTAALPLRPGETSPPFEVSVAAPGGTPAGAAPARPGSPGLVSTAWRYLRLGFTHIIPGGPDHALFVLGLFLLTPRPRAVAWQITAFTVAHTVTLTLATLHLVRLPAGIVEPTIAATIAFIGIENLATRRVHPWRPAVAFLFGLIHGLGFASALSEVGLPTGQLVSGLIAFSIGVECGHLAVLFAAFLLIARFRDRPWYRRRIAIPLSLAIAAIGLAWMGQRIARSLKDHRSGRAEAYFEPAAFAAAALPSHSATLSGLAQAPYISERSVANFASLGWPAGSTRSSCA